MRELNDNSQILSAGPLLRKGGLLDDATAIEETQKENNKFKEHITMSFRPESSRARDAAITNRLNYTGGEINDSVTMGPKLSRFRDRLNLRPRTMGCSPSLMRGAYDPDADEKTRYGDFSRKTKTENGMSEKSSKPQGNFPMMKEVEKVMGQTENESFYLNKEGLSRDLNKIKGSK